MFALMGVIAAAASIAASATRLRARRNMFSIKPDTDPLPFIMPYHGSGGCVAPPHRILTVPDQFVTVNRDGTVRFA